MVDVRACAARRAQREKAIQAAKDTLSEINAIGVQVKDLDIGLLDFPCKVNGEIVLLCWKMGEPTISHWHSTEDGLCRTQANRRPHERGINFKVSKFQRFQGFKVQSFRSLNAHNTHAKTKGASIWHP